MTVPKLPLLMTVALMTHYMTAGKTVRFEFLSVGTRTIDCPPGGQPDRPESDRPGWRVDGVLKNLHLGSRTVEVEGVTLSIETDTVVLIDCRRASLRELREGASVAALYTHRAGRHAVTVLEAGETHTVTRQGDGHRRR